MLGLLFGLNAARAIQGFGKVAQGIATGNKAQIFNGLIQAGGLGKNFGNCAGLLAMGGLGRILNPGMGMGMGMGMGGLGLGGSGLGGRLGMAAFSLAALRGGPF